VTSDPFNPLDKLSLARSIEGEILARGVVPLGAVGSVVGAGVYVIYYRGDFAPYAPLSADNKIDWRLPIYVGKAIPSGGRKGGISHAGAATGTALESRLRKHAASIRSVDNLDIAHFVVRSIVLDDIWIPLAENMLIETFKPLWNVTVEGFGINDPGKGRAQQKRSSWDVLHPGRLYAERLTGGGAHVSLILQRIDRHFTSRNSAKSG